MAEFRSLLIANRGEIAARIIRSASQMGLHTIALYSETDRGSPYLLAADQAIFLADDPARGEPFLDIERLVDVALTTGAEAVHPGYGFLSENGDFAQACVDAGLIFVGPSADVIRLMGDKGTAKQRMVAVGLPCVPGYQDSDQSDTRLRAEAEQIGLPLLIKASAGGGGRGMRRVDSFEQFQEALQAARSEALGAFGSDQVILERALDRVRHIEVQVAADQYGNVVHLGERDCSAQRRNQKVIEEAPSPVVDDALRAILGDAPVRATAAIGYLGVGTLEFLLTDDGSYHFIEMNTRLQVEHPVTEAICAIDLVAWQLQIAAGEALPKTQAEITFTGAAIEVRLYAEDPTDGFLPQAGLLSAWSPPTGSGLRVEHSLTPGSTITTHYDPMLAKIIAYGDNREIATKRLLRALQALDIAGVRSNRSFLIRALQHAVFQAGEVHTDFLPQLLAEPLPALTSTQLSLIAALEYRRRAGQWRTSPADWSSAGAPQRGLKLLLNGEKLSFFIVMSGEHAVVSTAEGLSATVTLSPPDQVTGLGSADVDSELIRYRAVASLQGLEIEFGGTSLTVSEERAGDSGGQDSQLAAGQITAPMDGRIIAVAVAEGELVEQGQHLMTLEAMKMEHRIRASRAGRLATVTATVDEQVARGELLATLSDLQ